MLEVFFALVYLVPMRVGEMTCRIWRINNTSARWHQRHHSACHSRLSLPPLKISMSVRVRRAAAAHNEILNPFVGTEKKRPVTMPKALGIKRGRLTVARADRRGRSTLSYFSPIFAR